MASALSSSIPAIQPTPETYSFKLNAAAKEYLVKIPSVIALSKMIGEQRAQAKLLAAYIQATSPDTSSLTDKLTQTKVNQLDLYIQVELLYKTATDLKNLMKTTIEDCTRPSVPLDAEQTIVHFGIEQSPIKQAQDLVKKNLIPFKELTKRVELVCEHALDQMNRLQADLGFLFYQIESKSSSASLTDMASRSQTIFQKAYKTYQAEKTVEGLSVTPLEIAPETKTSDSTTATKSSGTIEDEVKRLEELLPKLERFSAKPLLNPIGNKTENSPRGKSPETTTPPVMSKGIQTLSKPKK